MHRRQGERGAVAVEFVSVLPLVAMVLLLVAQVGLVVAQQLSIQHAAREGGRVLAVTNDAAAARAAAIAAAGLVEDRTEIAVTPAERPVGTPARVLIRYRPSVIPLIERFVPDDMVLAAAVTMRVERAAPES